MTLRTSPLAFLPLEKTDSKRSLEGPFRRMLGCDSGSSSIASSLENVLSVSCSHSHAKSVRLTSFSVVGLESALHTWSLWIKILNVGLYLTFHPQ